MEIYACSSKVNGHFKPEKQKYFEEKFWPLIDWEKINKKECSERKEPRKRLWYVNIIEKDQKKLTK
jgi:hypothetical protein